MNNIVQFNKEDHGQRKRGKIHHEYFVSIVAIIGNVAMLVEDLSIYKMQKSLQRSNLM